MPARNPKLSDDDVRLIRRCFPTAGRTVQSWADEYGLSWRAMFRVIKGQSWSWVTDVSDPIATRSVALRTWK